MSNEAADFKKHADIAIDEFMNVARIPPMTLRDYFAAAAISRCIEVAAQFVMEEPDFEPDSVKLSEIMRRAAGFAGVVADIMLKERSK
jgi:hypothetical protein